MEKEKEEIKILTDLTAAEFQQKHAEAITVLYGAGYDEQRLAFIERLTLKDYADILKKEAPEGLREALELPAKKPTDCEKKIASIYSYFDLWELVEIYERITPQNSFFLPTSPATFALNKVYGSLQRGTIKTLFIDAIREASEDERKKDITYTYKSGNDTITTTVKSKELLCELFADKKTSQGRKNGDLLKMFSYVLIECNKQSFKSPVMFNIHDLVDIGMYNDYAQASRSFDKYMDIIYNGFDYRIYKKRGNSEKETGVGQGHGFISSYFRDGSVVTINVDSGFDTSLLTEFYTLLPKWAFSLSPNAFDLIRYIFRRARQECKNIATKGSFNISMEKLSEYMGLPAYSGKDDYNRIRKPIEEALLRVENAILSNNDNDIKLEPYIKGEDIVKAKIKKWLFEGYIQVKLSGEYATYFSRFYNNIGSSIEKK